MVSLVKGVANYFYGLYDGYLWTLTIEEPRVQNWPLVKSPTPMFVLIALYYTIVYYGPRIMKDRQPFKLKWVLVFYNMGVTLLNLYICTTLFFYAWKLNYSWVCEPCPRIKTAEELQIAAAVWWYWFSKLIEFSDTFFFILRKKQKQLTFLHVYHHSTMFFLWWIGVKWVPGGATFVGAGLNSAVHVLMYSYYGLSAIGPSVQKYLWWKKYLTIIQLVQFTIALCLGVNGLRTNCDFPKWMQYTLITYMLSFIVLFGNFYRHAYAKKRRDAAAKKMDDLALANGKGSYANGAKNGSPLKQNGALKNGLVNLHSNGYTNNDAALRSRVAAK